MSFPIILFATIKKGSHFLKARYFEVIKLMRSASGKDPVPRRALLTGGLRLARVCRYHEEERWQGDGPRSPPRPERVEAANGVPGWGQAYRMRRKHS